MLWCAQVQENVIDLVGRIADRGHEYVPAREWMRICFDLLDMLKAHKKAIRRATVNTFGYVAKAIGPQVCAPPAPGPTRCCGRPPSARLPQLQPHPHAHAPARGPASPLPRPALLAPRRPSHTRRT